MARKARVAPGGFVYHTLNRAAGRRTLFESTADYRAFERLLPEAIEHRPMRILDYCLMPTHWHLVLWPEADGQLSAFVRWLSLTHAVRWHLQHGTTGTGHLYQNRFKAFPVESDRHFLTVCRYVERNPVRANLVSRAPDWRWSALWWRTHAPQAARLWLNDWPVDRPSDWLDFVNGPMSGPEMEAVRQSVRRSVPYGSPEWQVDIRQRGMVTSGPR